MKPKLDLSLYLIVGPSHVAGDPVPLVRAAVAGGATLLQLRDKSSDDTTLIESAKRLKAALAGTGVPLLINDRPDIASAAGADGVHVGQSDDTPRTAREMLGRDAIIGVTVKNPDHARAVDPDILDYASIGGVFQTTSKHNPDPPIGLEGVVEMAWVLDDVARDLPRCAIAGIDAGNARLVVEAGVDGVCVASAITQARDPEAAARRIVTAVGNGKRESRRSTP